MSIAAVALAYFAPVITSACPTGPIARTALEAGATP